MKYFYPAVIGGALLIVGGLYVTRQPAPAHQYVPQATTATPTQTGTPSTPKPTTSGTPAPTSAPKPASGYTTADVAKHSSQASCWTSINGSVYDLTQWIGMHPGGEGAILSICGADGTAAFEGQHGGQGRPSAMLARFRIGALAQ